MDREFKGSLLSTVFVDYDNIYLSLKRKSEEAAVRFAKDAGVWLQAIASGRLITPTNGMTVTIPRRIVLNRCYGNPVPRRNAQDNATDMNSFPFIRHHFLRAGFEVIDCPPLTAQLKNSADIRMVMDVRDCLLHDTYFDEFIILSGDADFTPLLHRLRQHARRTVVYANDYTAAPYTAISDGEIRESDLIELLTEGSIASDPGPVGVSRSPAARALQSPEMLAEARKAIIAEVIAAVRASAQPVLLETLADRAVRVLGHERTVGSAWGGAGSFRDLLAGALPAGIKMSDAAPYYVYDASRQLTASPRSYAEERPLQLRESSRIEPRFDSWPEGFTEIPLDRAPPAALSHAAPEREPADYAGGQQPYAPIAHHQPAPHPRTAVPDHQAMRPQSSGSRGQHAPAPRQPQAQTHATGRNEAMQHGHDAGRGQQSTPESSEASALQQSIARIHEACQAPPLSPPEYRALFDIMAREIETNGLAGARTLVNICDRARELGIELRKDDARFILEVVSEADPWFEQGASANLFASRFRNFVVARCKRQGLKLSATELDLIEAWFTGSGQNAAPRTSPSGPSGYSPSGPAPSSASPAGSSQARGASSPGSHAASASAYAEADRYSASRQLAPADAWRPNEARPDHRGMDRPADARPDAPTGYSVSGAARYNEFTGGDPDDEFPRIVRGRLRG